MSRHGLIDAENTSDFLPSHPQQFRKGAFVGNRPCEVQFSGVPRKQDEVPKCNLSPSEERQAAATGFHLKLLHQKKEHPSGLAKPLLL